MREGPPPENQRCGTCCWWSRIANGERGECHFAPPVFVVFDRQIDSRQFKGFWPEIDETDWCRHWAASRGWPPVEEVPD